VELFAAIRYPASVVMLIYRSPAIFSTIIGVLLIAGCASPPRDVKLSEPIAIRASGPALPTIQDTRSDEQKAAREVEGSVDHALWLSDTAFQPPLPNGVAMLFGELTSATQRKISLTRINVGVTRFAAPSRFTSRSPSYIPPGTAPGAAAAGILLGNGLIYLFEAGRAASNAREYWTVELGAVIDGRDVLTTNRERREGQQDVTAVLNELLSRSVRELLEIRARWDP